MKTVFGRICDAEIMLIFAASVAGQFQGGVRYRKRVDHETNFANNFFALLSNFQLLITRMVG